MIKTPSSLQELRRRIYVKGKSEPQWRFWGLYTHICKMETLYEAYKMAKRNNGASGIDGVTFKAVEANDGLDSFLQAIREELLTETYYPIKGRHVDIPKGDGKTRKLTIPSIKDRVVQGALKLILEPIFEADFKDGSYGYRPKRQAQQALHRVSKAIAMEKKTQIIDVDISKFFDNVRHHILLQKIAARVNDGKVMRLVKLILKSTGKKGLPQGGPFSPLASNIYLNEIDAMLEKAKTTTSRRGHTNIEYARFADDLVILIDHFMSNRWIVRAVIKRLTEELNKLGLQLNTQKTKIVNLDMIGATFSFLGFDYRSVRTKYGSTGVIRTPKKKARIEIQQKLKAVFKRKRSRSIKEVIPIINPILRGWVNYYRHGNSAECFGCVRDYVNKKIRRHLYQARQQRGFGWKRWSYKQLVKYTGVFDDYRIIYLG